MTSCPPNCGHCCDPVVLSWDPDKRIHDVLVGPQKTDADPATDEGWERWRRTGWQEDDRETAIQLYRRDPAHESVANMLFIRDHWTLIEHKPDVEGDTAVWKMRCDAFDSHARACTAYDTRPPICSGYPFYGNEPTVEDGDERRMSHICAFQDDIPGRKVLPLVEVRHGTA